MSRVPPLATTTTPELAPLLEQAERAMGYLPNDVLSLCHWPELLQSPEMERELECGGLSRAAFSHLLESFQTSLCL